MKGLSIRTGTGETVDLPETAVERFAADVRGAVVTPESPAYDEARAVHNAMHDRRPALVVRAADVADAIATVALAREHGLLLAVRGGGHSVPGFGTCEGGVVLDLGRMKGIRVDPERRVARVEGGCTWGDLDHATHAFGLATPGGIVSTTGVAGLTLGGGMGHLSRRFGLSCDNLLSADVVTADGRFLTCSEDCEKDLFWALRGGGGNFGVVTSFAFRLHPVSEVFGGPVFFPLDPAVLRAYHDLVRDAPEELGAVLSLTLAPPLPFVPEEWHGRPVAAVVTCWSGPLDEGPDALAPVRELGPAVAALLGPLPYPELNRLFDAIAPPGLQQYWKGCFTRELSEPAIAAHVEHAAGVPCVESGTFVFPLDGACHRVPPEATAFPPREAAFSTVIAGAWPDAADNARNVRWVREYYEALRPHSEAGGYVNFMSEDDEHRVRENYGLRYHRLAEIKARYDPTNLFRMNQNVEPLGRQGAGARPRAR